MRTLRILTIAVLSPLLLCFFVCLIACGIVSFAIANKWLNPWKEFKSIFG